MKLIIIKEVNMRIISRIILAIFALSAVFLGACSGIPAASSPGSSKVLAIPVQYTGVVESVNGTQWVVSGQTLTVDPSVVHDGPFLPGDTIKLEVVVGSDGSVQVSRVESPSTTDLSALPQFGDDNSNNANDNSSNINDDNINTANGNDSNINDDNSNGANENDSNINDDNGNDSNINDDSINNSNGSKDNSGKDNGNGGGDDNGGNDDGDSGGGDD
jgi:hypothetical protein